MGDHQIFIEERKKSPLQVQELGELIYTPALLSKFVQLQALISGDPILRNNPAHLGLSRAELFDIYMAKTHRLNEMIDLADYNNLKLLVPLFGEQLGATLHTGMFLTTLKILSDEQQYATYVPRAENFQIIGCYAQTELGHGSDVQSLELQAIFDKQTQEFVMHSPTVGSTKWWIGDLGKNANHCVTQAQIMVDGKRKALGTFILQIRDMATHQPLAGIEVGDIGPKYGYNTKDNGFIRFNQYRVPKSALLAKYMTISEEGKVSKVGNEKLSYGTMMKIRTLIMESSAKALGQSLTICTRYSLIRCQFKGEGGIERQVMDYQTQQNKIAPLVALGYAMSQAQLRTVELIDQNQALMDKNDFSMLNAMHCLISGYKSHFTSQTLEGIEQLRAACGGHGYLQYSGLPGILQEFAPTATYEGENTILYLQTARYLMKAYNKAAKNKSLDQFTAYMAKPKNTLKSKLDLGVVSDSPAYLAQLSSVDSLQRMLTFNSLYRVSQAATKLTQAVMSKMDLSSAWNQKAGISLADAAQAHTFLSCFSMFRYKVDQLASSPLKEVMTLLLRIYGLERVLEKPSALYAGGMVCSAQFRLLRTKVKEQLLEEVRPHLLTLVEGFHFDDNSLRSAIGMKNGRPYETLFEWVTQHNPVNKKEVTDRIVRHWVGASAKL